MAYFPFFVELAGKTGLIVGGGRTALGKARRLADYGSALTVVAPEVLPELAALEAVTVRRRAFSTDDLDADCAYVIAATDDRAVNHRISALCRERGIPVNVVDTPEDCSFLFPALVRRGPLSIGISTGGASPTGAIFLKEEICALLPEQIGAIFEWLERCRAGVKRSVPDEADRKTIFQALFRRALALGRPLTEDETCNIIHVARGEAQL